MNPRIRLIGETLLYFLFSGSLGLTTITFSEVLVSKNITHTYALIFVLIGLILITVLYLVVQKKKHFFEWNKIDLMVLALFILISFHTDYTWGEMIRMEKFMLNVLITTVYFGSRLIGQVDRKRLNLFLYYFAAGIILSGMIQTTYGLMQLYGWASPANRYFQVTGNYSNPTPLAMHLAISVSLSTYAYFHWKKLPYLNFYQKIGKLGALLNMLLTLTLLPALMIRTSWLMVGASTVCILFDHYRETLLPVIKKWKKLLFITIPLTIVTLLAFTYTLKKDSANGRVFIYQIALSKVIDSPWLGHGFNSFRANYNEWQADGFESGRFDSEGAEAALAGSVKFAYNEGLEFVVENGLMGGIVLILIGWVLIRKMRTNYYRFSPVEKMSLIMLIGLLVASFTSYPLQFGLMKLMGMIGLAILVSSFSLPSLLRIRTGALRMLAPLVAIGVICVAYLVTISLSGYQLTRQARRQMQSGNYEWASQIYENLTKENTLSEDIYLQEYAKCLSLAGRFEESNKVLENSVRFSSDSFFHIMKGENYTGLKEYEEAEVSYLRAYHMAPSRIYPLYLMAKMYEASGQKKKAMKRAHQVLNKEVKIDSRAVKEIHEEMNRLIERLTSETQGTIVYDTI